MTPESHALILNVDDNDGARYAKSRVLSRAGFEVIEAATGASALEKVRADSPDLVLLDVKLPDINGLDVCRQIKLDPQTATTVVLQTSAAAVHTVDKVRALDGGADSYLTEPIEPAELIANVRALLRLRNAESALRESEERFRQLADNVDDVFWMLDPAHDTLLYISPAYRTLWGREPVPSARGITHWSEGVCPDDAPRIAEAAQALRRGERYEQEYRVERPDGSLRWVRERAFPVPDATGRPYRLAGIVTDITERKTSELLLREADRRKDQFLAMLAHELRNPLAPIRNAVEIMDPRNALSREALDEARMIVSRQVTHLSRLVDDLLDVSRITQGKITLRHEPVDLAAAISAAIETVHPMIDRKHHTLRVVSVEEPVILMGDAVRVAQVIGNLLSNASKYTPEGGTITLSAEARPDTIAIRITDNGIGIDASMLPHIFELFVQSESSLERSEGGLGIGLPLAKRLVELHGGRLDARSAGIGHGSEFTATWPRRVASVSEVPVQKDNAVEDAVSARRVLLVDDSVDAASAMSLLLETLGHDVHVAHDGMTALEMAGQWTPEVVILDIGLPGMDGYQIARAMRERETTAGALLIALTGYGQASDRQRSHEAGFDIHFVKPVSFNEIEQAIAERGSHGTPRNMTPVQQRDGTAA
ncbi:histidine kinase [Pararobbsia alpina]|uniref:ATP-binding response regulator n=1 Tax=Pararobbsia alpina TaxID=621374 RepID=UPI0039A64E48